MDNIDTLIKKSYFDTKNIEKEIQSTNTLLRLLNNVCENVEHNELFLSTLPIQEAQQSSAIENIITTQDALFREKVSALSESTATKEAYSYVLAINNTWQYVVNKKDISLELIENIQSIILPHKSGYRENQVYLKDKSGNIVYEPPEPEEIEYLLFDFESFVNSSYDNLHPLIKMGLTHYLFEAIHPFRDGNGRTGRIINILFLLKEKLLDFPILYLSRYINQTRPDYYFYLKNMLNQNLWEDWTSYFLQGIQITAENASNLILQIDRLNKNIEEKIMNKLPKIYSKEIMNLLFQYPYTKIPFVQKELNITKPTAMNYLDKLEDIGILKREKRGRERYYLNHQLLYLLNTVPKYG